MKDYDAEREKPSVSRTYVKEDGTRVYSRGPFKPYNALLETLGATAKALSDRGDYDAMRRLAWDLGMNGEHHACEVIITELNRPRYRSPIIGAY